MAELIGTVRVPFPTDALTSMRAESWTFDHPTSFLGFGINTLKNLEGSEDVETPNSITTGQIWPRGHSA